MGFYARQLRGAEKRYSATELEGLAVLLTILHFSHYLYGRPFEVVTDHQALCAFHSLKVLNRRLRSWTLRLQDFDFIVRYRRGSANANTDGLSRQAEGELPPNPASRDVVSCTQGRVQS